MLYKIIFFVSKTIGYFLVPPGFIVLLLIITLLLLFLKKLRAAKILLIFTLFLTYLLSIEPVKDMLLSPLENRFNFPQSLNCNYIVVLGGGQIYHSKAFSNKPAPSCSTLKRLVVALKVYKSIKKPIIVSGGLLRQNAYPEAYTMKNFLVRLGVGGNMIIEDNKSKNTFENALFVKRIVKHSKICLITSAYHMPRSMLIFKSFGIKAQPVPADYKIYHTPYGYYSFVPHIGYFRDSSIAIKEYIGIAYFYLIERFFKKV